MLEGTSGVVLKYFILDFVKLSNCLFSCILTFLNSILF